MSLRTIVIRWEGPHTLESVQSSGLRNGLYFLNVHKNKQEDQIRYFGYTEQTYHKRFKQGYHPVNNHKSLQIWLGQIEYPQDFGRDLLRLAEACLIYFWQPALNNVGKIRPSKPVCIVSRWTKPDGSMRRKRLNVYKDLPDVLWWGEDEYWRTGNLTPRLNA